MLSPEKNASLIVSNDFFVNSSKIFSFQCQESFSNKDKDNKENINFKPKDLELNLEGMKEERKAVLGDKDPNLFRQKLSKEIDDINQILENKNLILKKLKVSKQEKPEEYITQLNEDVRPNKMVKCTSTIKKHLNFQDKENILNKNFDLESLNDTNESKNIFENLKNNTKMIEDYKKQIDLLERNFENQKNLQFEISEYRKLIPSFEDKINLLIDDNQRLVNLIEIERDEMHKFKENSDDIIKKSNEKIVTLEKEIKFKEDRYNELLICLDSYKAELEKMKNYRAMNEKDRTKLLDESKKNNIKFNEMEKNDQKNKTEMLLLKTKIESLESEESTIKAKKESLEKSIQDLLKKNETLNKDLNDRIIELNKIKKQSENSVQEFTIEKEKLVLQIQSFKTQLNEIKNVKEKESFEFKEEIQAVREKLHIAEKESIKKEEKIRRLEMFIEKIEKEKQEKEKTNELFKSSKLKEFNTILQEIEEMKKENQRLMLESERIINDNTYYQKINKELQKNNDELKISLALASNNFKTELETFNNSANNNLLFQINEISKKYEKEILEKAKIINDLNEKIKEITKESYLNKQKNEECKQKLIKMDYNYSKAMKELQMAYDQERKIKEKNFQIHADNLNALLFEKEKLIKTFTKEKEDLLNLLKKTTDRQHDYNNLQKMFLAEKDNKIEDRTNWMAIKNRIKNHSAEREENQLKKERNGFQYRRSLHCLKENDNLNHEITNRYSHFY